MQRPDEHVTDSLGQTQLRSTLEPRGWTLAPAVDYGIDFDVEVFSDNRATGITFKVQLKSSRSTKYSASGDFVSQTMEVRNAKYLTHQMQTPTVLVHADVERGGTFWTAPQLDADVAQRVEVSDDDASVTFRIPTANSLPEAAEALLQAVGRAKVVLAAQAITKTPPVDFVSALRDRPDMDATIREFRRLGDALRRQRAYDLFLAGKLEDSAVDLARLLEDSEVELEVKLGAVLILEQVETRQAIREQKPDEFREGLAISAADRLKRLTANGPPHLRLYAIMTRTVAELRVLMHENWGVFLNVQIAKQHGASPLWTAQLAYRWSDVTQRINLKLSQCFRLVNYAVSAPYGWALSDPVLRLGKAYSMLAVQLRVQEQHEAEKNMTGKAFELFRLAAETAKRVGDEGRLVEAACAARLISGDKESESYRWMVAELARIKDADARRAAEDYVDRLERRERGEKLDGEIVTSEKQIYENMAVGAGIDLDDPDDPVARLVRIGIGDLDPSRVLRHCEHFFVTLQPDPVVFDMVKLQTAGNKVLHCTKHGCAVSDEALDGAYALFNENFCSSCPDGSPRAADWRWSEDWQRQENEIHAKFAREFWRRGRQAAGPR